MLTCSALSPVLVHVRERRGRWQKGPVIGPGPLPVGAMHELRDPKLEAALKQHYWDAHGRRHLKDANSQETDLGVQAAMKKLRGLAATVSASWLSSSVLPQFTLSRCVAWEDVDRDATRSNVHNQRYNCMGVVRCSISCMCRFTRVTMPPPTLTLGLLCN